MISIDEIAAQKMKLLLKVKLLLKRCNCCEVAAQKM
jgi:hypothetical protein